MSHDTIARIRKCLALAKSDNLHEAQLAWDTATRLLAEHQLTLADVTEAPLLVRYQLVPRSAWEVALLHVSASAAGVVPVIGVMSWMLYSTDATALDGALTVYTQLHRALPTMALAAWKQHVVDLTDPQLGVYPSVLEPGAREDWLESWLRGAVAGLAQRDLAFDGAYAALVARVRTEVPGVRSARRGDVQVWTVHAGGYDAGTEAAEDLPPLVPPKGALS